MAEISNSYYDNGWIEFKQDLNIKPETIFEEYKRYFGLGEDDEMILEKINHDDKGNSHYRYQQYYKGIKVLGMRYLIHSRNGIVYSANGKIVANLNYDISKTYTNEQVVNIAIGDNKGCKIKYGLERVKMNRSNELSQSSTIQIIKDDENGIIHNSNFVLVNSIKIYDITEKDSVEVRVEMGKSKVHSIKSDRRYGWADYPTSLGTVNTLYNGEQSFYTYYHNGGSLGCPSFYYLDKIGSGSNYLGGALRTLSSSCDALCYKPCFRDSDNIWEQSHETSAFWATQKAMEYFENVLGGTNFKYPADKTIWVDSGLDFDGVPNAYFSPHTSNPGLNFGQAIPGVCNHMVSLDIVGHEYTHGEIYYATGGLSYVAETGAIEEGLADIFGALIQTSIEGYSHDRTYTIGEDVFLVDDYKRSLINPKSLGLHAIDASCEEWDLGQPDTYMGQYWDTRGCDLGGVHTNATIMGHWFYLLAEGGLGTNDNGKSYNVNGIGRDKAAKIAFAFIENYIEYGSNFSDARNGTLMAAMDEYQICSDEFVQVANAWHAVGVTSSLSAYNVINPCSEIYAKHVEGLPYYKESPDYFEINCDLTLYNNTSTYLKAVNEIVFKPGFKISSGSTLLAKVNPCIETSNLKSASFGGKYVDQHSESIIEEEENKSIDELEINRGNYGVQLYPNPTNGIVYVDLGLSIRSEIEVYNSIGLLLITKSNYESTFTIDMSNQLKGIYFYVIKTDYGITRSRIIKK
jgi:Zn-dependent metalloprotease